jgi:hypothetical protein
MIPLVEHETEDRTHGLDGDGFLLRAWHVEDMVLDAVLVQEGLVTGWKLFLDEGAG